MIPSPPALHPERVRALVFDLDGTLVDSYRPIAASLNHVRGAHGLPPVAEAEVRRAVGRGLDSLLAGFLPPERIREGVRLFREHHAGVLDAGTSPLPGAVETVRELDRRGYRVGVASNKASDFAERILVQLGMRSHVHAVLGPERAGAPKPEPAMIHLCLLSLGVRAEQAVYVGDMALDVESAARAGVPVVLVPGGSSEAEDLVRTGQTVVRTLADLLDLLPARPGRP